MEYMGHSSTAVYMTGPRIGGSSTPTFLPSIAIKEAACKPYDTYPAPTPFRRSLITLPWRPSSFYGSSRVEPCLPSADQMPKPESELNQLRELDSIKVPPVFAAARNALYTRYSNNDWNMSNNSNYMASTRVRGAAELLRSDTFRLVHEVEDKTRRAQQDSGKKLGQRMSDVTYWKKEVQNEMDAMTAEIDALYKAKCCLERACGELENTMQIDQECLYWREMRQGIDLVHDQVEDALIKEVDNVKRIQEEMRRTILDANNALALDRAALHELEKDSADKFVALNLDGVAHQMRNTARGIFYHDGVERVDNTNSIPDSWAEHTNRLIEKSMAERRHSQEMRKRILLLLEKSAELLMFHWNSVNNAFSDRIAELVETKHKLQTHLSKVLQEIFDMEKNIDLIKKQIDEEGLYMKVAQTRLETRLRRPNMEGCRDHAQHRMVEEVYQIDESVDSLKAKLREAENALQHLLRTKASLEHDLSVKLNSLFIDRERCMGLRKTYPMAPRVACY